MGSNSTKRHSGTTFGRHHGHPLAASKASGSLRRRGKRNVTLVATCPPDSPSPQASTLGRSDTTNTISAPHFPAPLAVIVDGKAIPTTCSLLVSNMTGLIRIYLPSSLGSNSLQSAVDLLIQPVEPSAGSKMPAFTFRPVPKSSIPSMDAPHVLMDYVSLRKLVTMRKEMLLSDRPHNGECERRSAATELATQTADDLHSPALPPELDLGLDADGQELVWMMEFASSESGDSAVMSGCGCGDSTHAGDAQVEDDELVPKIVEVVEEDPLHELAPTLSHRGATVFESLTDLDAFPPLPDSPASSIFGDDFDIHSSLPDSVPASGAVNSEPTSSTQLNLQRPSIERAPCTSNATLASSPILKETDLTPVASPTIDAVEHGEHPESPMSPSNKALALDTPTAEPAQVLASRAVSAVQEGHGSVESQLPETASAVEAAPMLPRTVSEPISPAPSKSVVRPPPVSRVASDSAMSVSMASPADGGGASTPLRESVDFGSSTMRTSKSSKSSLIKRFSQSFLTLTRTGKHDKQREDLAVPPTPTQTTLGSSLSLSHSVDLAPLSPVAPAIVQPATGAEESSKLLKKKSKLFSSLFGGKGQGHDEDKAAKKERKAQEKAEKAARKEAKRFAKALTS